MEKLLIIFYLSVKFTDVFFNPTTQHNTKCNWQYKENTIKKSVQTIFFTECIFKYGSYTLYFAQIKIISDNIDIVISQLLNCIINLMLKLMETTNSSFFTEVSL